jgi:hypothetical protein
MNRNPETQRTWTPSRKIQMRAVAMQLVTDPQGRYLELHIVTDNGEAVAITCNSDLPLAVQWHREKTGGHRPNGAPGQ